jgi:hypothetical protein
MATKHERISERKVIEYTPEDTLELANVVVPDDGKAEISIDERGGLKVVVTRLTEADWSC